MILNKLCYVGDRICISVECQKLGSLINFDTLMILWSPFEKSLYIQIRILLPRENFVLMISFFLPFMWHELCFWKDDNLFCLKTGERALSKFCYPYMFIFIYDIEYGELHRSGKQMVITMSW